MSPRQLRRIQAEVLDRGARRAAFLGDDRACRSLADQLDKIPGSPRCGTIELYESWVSSRASRAAGKPPKGALPAIMCKLIILAHALIRDGTTGTSRFA
jgi:hypothetical protein